MKNQHEIEMKITSLQIAIKHEIISRSVGGHMITNSSPEISRLKSNIKVLKWVMGHKSWNI